ncbi:hypothetical protein C8A05DRAFT_44022 [Staphylotrichum tortipilum]|uniref:DUF7924 domain-containing protein n=1 Tax=Staphylotrichum tortipilum TaxID=2831512 RepID=A0AAN6MKJ0_9PEZI|nr:hypothetical protein C8A05DRAFT_44022 [Staphylotrichum longicolle]
MLTGPEFPRQQRDQSAVNADFPSLAKSSWLTRENLAMFNKISKKGTSWGSASSPTAETDSSSITSCPALRATDNGILHPEISNPPTNLADIRKQHARSRETASPPESRHVGLNNRLPAPEPDFVEGLEMKAFRPHPFATTQVSGATLYQDDTCSVTLPHLAGEWKRDEGGMDKAIQQSAYVGAALVYAMNQPLSLIGKPDLPGHAVVRTFASEGNHLSFFAHYAAPSEEDGSTEYYQFRYASVEIRDTYQQHKEGRQGLRNTQDYARDQSYALRDQLETYWQQQRHRSSGPRRRPARLVTARRVSGGVAWKRGAKVAGRKSEDVVGVTISG